jgi:phage terminase large subunit-like protein
MDPEDVEDGVAAAYLRGNIEHDVPIFPEEFDMEFYTRMRKNPKVYASQYANNPKEGGLNEFEPSWLKFYNFNWPYVFTFDGDKSMKTDIATLDRVIMIDPSMGENDKSDESAIIVAGMDANRRIYVLECIKERIRPPDLISRIFKLHAKWRPRLISFEEVAFSGLFSYWFKDKCEQLGVYPSVYHYKPGGKRSKLARVRGLAPYFSSGQIYIQEGMHKFRDEYEWFGVTNSDHILDALAQGPEIWAPGTTEQRNKENHEAEEWVMNQRSALTGY